MNARRRDLHRLNFMHAETMAACVQYRRLFTSLVLQQLEYLPLDMNSAKASDLDELLDQKRRVPLGGFPDLC
ncbi:MAG TPA: hypothetical protein VJX94_32360 [Stellaceae bacterium]|nr:hypothetical protein [Stellaceae bacterium]